MGPGGPPSLRLCGAARAYHAEDISAWRDPELQLAINWRETARPNDAWAQRYDSALALTNSFLDVSRDERDNEIKLEDRKREAAFLRWKRAALLGLVLVMTLIAVGAWAVNSNKLAVNATKKAEAAEEDAIDQSRIADRAKKDAANAQADADAATEDAEERREEAKKAVGEADDALAKVAEQEKRLEELDKQEEENAAQLKQTQSKLGEIKGKSDDLKRTLADMEIASAHMKIASAHMKIASAHMKIASAHMKIASAELEDQVTCRSGIAGRTEHRIQLTRMVSEALTVARTAPLLASQEPQVGAGLAVEAYKRIGEINSDDRPLSPEVNAACASSKITPPDDRWSATTPEDKTALNLALSEVWRQFDTTSGEHQTFEGVPVRALAIDTSQPKAAKVFYGLANGEIHSADDKKEYHSDCDCVLSLTFASNKKDGQLLAAGCVNGRVLVFPIDNKPKGKTGKKPKEETEEIGEIAALDVGASITSLVPGHRPEHILYATTGGKVGIIDLSAPREDWAGADIPGVQLDDADPNAKAFLATSRDGRTLALAWQDAQAQGQLHLASYSHETGAWVKPQC